MKSRRFRRTNERIDYRRGGFGLLAGDPDLDQPLPSRHNIAAISYIGRRVGSSRLVLVTGLLYVLGRMLTYMALSMILAVSLLSIPRLSLALQKYFNVYLGPVLILAGVLLLGIIKVNLTGPGVSDRLRLRAERWGVWGAGLLGILFALSFCPISAALFFGSLVPLTVRFDSRILLPLVYGVGTALPVILFAFLRALGTGAVGRVFDRLSQIERWARWITGAIFILVGTYYTLIYIFHLPL